MLSSWWNVLLNRNESEMVEDVVKVLDHIMKWERVNVYSAYIYGIVNLLDTVTRYGRIVFFLKISLQMVNIARAFWVVENVMGQMQNTMDKYRLQF